MGLGDLSNCSRCGKVFVKTIYDICPNCVKEIDEEYHICAEYLRENKMVNIYELSEATGVSVRQITQFIREGRISIVDNPNMGYPCESCGTVISKGRLCKKCSDRLTKGIKKVLEEKELEQEINNPEKKEKTYYQFGVNFKSKNNR
ncbi:hypothetical protein BHF71_08785 [Vulcanibacillus modesticaldus]|uniref:Flagellar protein n=1 Tax=Vulcanibacillus modesticaldus TaxID=337097 RepID=A0A1D2YUW6_9BACI|nr:TIGR03826 family flagellar region protein [Vulcanibacillus modesticaldus]OEF99504.1 hypothetical protein BHF71_08785 [Vulcanibacillus modesticaldus]